jgi:hypothetical protein
MLRTKKNTTRKPAKKKRQPKRLVSATGVHTEKDSMSEFFDKMNDMVKNTRFLP